MQIDNLSLIFTIIGATMMIVKAIKKNKGKDE